MAKRKMAENSLLNLKKGSSFATNGKDFARNAQKKSVEKRKENKMLKDVALDILNKTYNDGSTFQEKAICLIEEQVLTGVLKPDELIKLLTFLRDTSGQKPVDKQEVNGQGGYSVIINHEAVEIEK